jgi:hypothetical protein
MHGTVGGCPCTRKESRSPLQSLQIDNVKAPLRLSWLDKPAEPAASYPFLARAGWAFWLFRVFQMAD